MSATGLTAMAVVASSATSSSAASASASSSASSSAVTRRCPLRKVAAAAGFTLVELLVVVAIIAALTALALPVILHARSASERVREVASARMLSMAWQQYAQDANGAILPGYKSGLPAYDETHGPIATQTIGVAANRWVWRLAPYIGHDLRALYVGDHERLLHELEATDMSNYLYQTSVFPSFGLNSVWVGGDETYGGFNSAFLGLFGKFYASRLSEIPQPASLIVFGSAHGQDAAPGGGMGELTEGFFRVRSPNFDTRTWASAYDAADAASWGNLSARHGGDIVVSYADGHAEPRAPQELDDMRLWAPNADAKDWKLTPQQ